MGWVRRWRAEGMEAACGGRSREARGDAPPEVEGGRDGGGSEMGGDGGRGGMGGRRRGATEWWREEELDAAARWGATVGAEGWGHGGGRRGFGEGGGVKME
jgi:hypothetical protein